MRRIGFIAVWSLLLGVTVHGAQVGLIKINAAIAPIRRIFFIRTPFSFLMSENVCGFGFPELFVLIVSADALKIQQGDFPRRQTHL